MTDNSIAHNERLVQSLNKAELKVWQVASSFPTGEDGIIPTDALGKVWPEADALRAASLVWQTVCRLNGKLRPYGYQLKVVSNKGYRLCVGHATTHHSPMKQSLLLLGDALLFALHHIDTGGEDEAFAREWLWDMCAATQLQLLAGDQDFKEVLASIAQAVQA